MIVNSSLVQLGFFMFNIFFYFYFSQKVDYITYLSIFDHLFDIPRERKNSDYRNYIRILLTYLKDFVNRVKPLQDQAMELAIAHQEFVKQWDSGTFPGWPVRYFENRK